MSNNNNNNNNNNNSNSKNLLEKKNLKMYASLALYAILGLALGYAIAKGALHLMNRSKMSNIKTENSMSTTTDAVLTTFNTSLKHNFEGDNKADAAFDYSDVNNVTASTKTANLYTVNNAKGEKVATVYFYFNGARGATPEEYVTETIKKSVPTVSAPANANYGSTVWARAESGATEWHLKTATNKDWLIYVESATANNTEVSDILKSVDVK